MELLYSTTKDLGSEPLLPSAHYLSHSHGYEVWSVRMPLPQFIDAVRLPLVRRQIVSACALRELPPADKQWLFFEWHGRLLIDRNYVQDVLYDGRNWKQTQVREDFNVTIFEPVKSAVADVVSPAEEFVAQTTHYQALLKQNARGEVLLYRSWIESEEARRQLFGEFADPRVGGAFALLSLSGADRAEGSFQLRTPASLDLTLDKSLTSLTAKPIREALSIRCIGFSHIRDLARADTLKTSMDQWAKLHKELNNVGSNNFFLAVELDASHDPTIAIKRGSVFEQRSLNAVQTLAAAVEHQTIVDADEVKPLIIPAYCLNSDLGPPNGNSMRPTPFVYRHASGSQDAVWRARRNA